MKVKILTVLTVMFFFSWGTLSWTTGDLMLADRLTFLSNLRTIVFFAAAAAVLLRDRLKSLPTTTLIIWGSAICAVGIGMMIMPQLLPVGYLLVGLARILLVAATLELADDVFDAAIASGLTAGGFYLMNALLKPFVETQVEAGRWRISLIIAVGLVGVSALTTWLVGRELEGAEGSAVPPAGVTDRLGSGALCFLGIQVAFGLLSIAVLPLAERLLGARTDSGTLEGFRQLFMFVGVIVPFLYKGPISLRALLWTQCAAYILILAGTRFGVGSLAFVGIALDGLCFALLERESETRYLQGLKGLPNRSTALQLLNGSYRLTTALGEQIAGRAPLMLSLWLAPTLPLALLAVMASPLSNWTSVQLRRLALRNPTDTQEE